jgi:acyl carrier protein
VNEQDILSGVIATIKGIAPEVEEGELVADRALREQVDLDSMDWLNVIIGLHERFGVDIPESDYAKLTSLKTIVAYVGARAK